MGLMEWLAPEEPVFLRLDDHSETALDRLRASASPFVVVLSSDTALVLIDEIPSWREEAGFDQHGWELDLRSGRILGVVARDYAISRLEEGVPLSEADPKLKPSEVDLWSSLSEVVKVIVKCRAALVVSRWTTGRVQIIRDDEDLDNPVETPARENTVLHGIIGASQLEGIEIRTEIYRSLAALELTLLRIVNRFLPDNRALLEIFKREQERGEIESRFEKLRMSHPDARPSMVLTLSQLLTALDGQNGVRRQLVGSADPAVWRGACGRLVELRVRIMHPVRPLIETRDDVSVLGSDLDRLDSVLARARGIVP